MKTKNSQTTTKATSLPGEDHSQQYAMLQRVLESLAPGVAEKCPDFVHLLQYYLLMAEDDPSGALVESKLRQNILKIIREESTVSAMDFMMTIEGMRSVRIEHQFHSLEELQQFTQASKDAFREFMDEPPANERTDSVQRPAETNLGNI
jgi:hypothetical protein